MSVNQVNTLSSVALTSTVHLAIQYQWMTVNYCTVLKTVTH